MAPLLAPVDARLDAALGERVLNRAQMAGASYADVRLVHRRTEGVHVRDGKADGVSDEASLGLGVRVLVKGAWGFASAGQPTEASADRAVDEAIAIAKASAAVGGPQVDLGPANRIVATYATPVEEDPFAVPMAERLAILLAADAAMRSVEGVRVTMGSIQAFREDKLFLSTEGARIMQTIVETGCGIEAVAVGASEIQMRSYPNSFGRDQVTGGFEMVRLADLPGNAQRIAEEAVALLGADPCPSKETTLILDPTQLGLQIHESIGHAIELDRVLGYEAGYAGTSFLKPSDSGELVYGSSIVNVNADATLPGGLGSFGYDDEGTPAQRVPIIEAGRFTGFLSCRETASQLGKASGGMARADGWGRIPMTRMTNVNLEPGDSSLARMIEETEDGIYMLTNRSWSIDDKRVNFQFGCQLAYEIKGGKLGRMLKNPTYTGITPIFWGHCDAIAGPEEWRIWGTPNCGKGQPMQVAHVGHGCAPARFQKVTVGVAQ